MKHFRTLETFHHHFWHCYFTDLVHNSHVLLWWFCYTHCQVSVLGFHMLPFSVHNLDIRCWPLTFPPYCAPILSFSFLFFLTWIFLCQKSHHPQSRDSFFHPSPIFCHFSLYCLVSDTRSFNIIVIKLTTFGRLAYHSVLETKPSTFHHRVWFLCFVNDISIKLWSCGNYIPSVSYGSLFNF